MTSLTPEPVDLPTPNLPLLRKILDHIDAHPEEWQQAAWAEETACGATFCIAGHAVAMSEGVERDALGYLAPASGRDWIEAGADALGITINEAWNPLGSLFRAGNDRQDVQRYAEAIAARAGERL